MAYKRQPQVQISDFNILDRFLTDLAENIQEMAFAKKEDCGNGTPIEPELRPVRPSRYRKQA